MTTITVKSGAITVTGETTPTLVTPAGLSQTINASSVAERTLDGAITGGVTTSVAPDTDWDGDMVYNYVVIDAWSNEAEVGKITGASTIVAWDGGTFTNSHSAGAPIKVIQGFIDAQWFGLNGENVGSSGTDMTAELQNACNAGIDLNMKVVLPHGTILFDHLDLTNVGTFSNTEPTGFILEGQGLGTKLLHNEAANTVAIDFAAGAGFDVVFVLKDFFLTSNDIADPANTAIRVGENRAVCRLENLHIYGFFIGVTFADECDGPFTIQNCVIRSCRKNAIFVDSTVTYITHLIIIGGLIENNGFDATEDSQQYYAIDLNDCQNVDLFDVVIQGNASGAIYSRNNNRQFNMWGGRVEETALDYAVNYVIRIDTDYANAMTLFQGAQFAYLDGGGTYNNNLIYTGETANTHQITFRNCYFENTGTTTTSTLNHSASSSGTILYEHCILTDCAYGNGMALYIDTDAYKFRNAAGSVTEIAT